MPPKVGLKVGRFPVHLPTGVIMAYVLFFLDSPVRKHHFVVDAVDAVQAGACHPTTPILRGREIWVSEKGHGRVGREACCRGRPFICVTLPTQ